MPTNLGFETPGVALATRTLLLAGYIIENSQRQPTHIELLCQATSPLSAHISFLIAITDREQFSPELTLQLREVAGKQGRSLVLVAARTGEDCLGWGYFLDALGGPVASWRALSDEYGQNLVTASQNRNPPGVNGEAWRLFEDLVAD